MNNAYKDKVAIITGASSGIGRELALQIAEMGGKLSLGARRLDKLEELAEECKLLGGEAIVAATDVGDEEQCKRLVERTVETFGGVDILFNNAGITVWSKFEDMQTMKPYEDVMRVNYYGSLYCTNYALPYLKKTKGRIVNLSSMAGKIGVPMRSGYAASKFAIAGFFETLRIELGDSGVSVTMIYPDFVQTGTRLQAYGSDGQLVNRNPNRKGRVMTVERAVDIILNATAKRKREEILSVRGKLAVWLKLIAPKILDKIANRAVEKTM